MSDFFEVVGITVDNNTDNGKVPIYNNATHTFNMGTVSSTTIYTGDSSLTGNRVVSLDSKTLKFKQGTSEFLSINPTVDSETALLQAKNTVEETNIAYNLNEASTTFVRSTLGVDHIVGDSDGFAKVTAYAESGTARLTSETYYVKTVFDDATADYILSTQTYLDGLLRIGNDGIIYLGDQTANYGNGTLITVDDVNKQITSSTGFVKQILDEGVGKMGYTNQGSNFAYFDTSSLAIDRTLQYQNRDGFLSTVVGGADAAGKTAAISATTVYPVESGQSGMYLVTWNADITTAASTSSVLGGTNGFQLIYTSPTDSVVKTTVAGNSVTSTANTTGTAISGSMMVYAKESTNIQYSFGYTSVGVTPMAYQLHVKVTAL